MKVISIVLFLSFLSTVGCNKQSLGNLGDVFVVIPNVILPSSDSENVFYPSSRTENLTVEYMEIYSRLGNLLFRADDFPVNDPASGWDGTFGGKLVEPGTYTYSMNIINGVESRYFGGELTVIR